MRRMQTRKGRDASQARHRLRRLAMASAWGLWLLLLNAAACSGNTPDGQAGPAAAAGSASAALCSGRPGRLRGQSTQRLMVAGLDRSFIYYAPTTLDPNTPAPIVFVAHGHTMTADMMVDITQFSELAEREKFIAIYPTGQTGTNIRLDGPWNVGVGQNACPTALGVAPVATGDDQAFVDAMVSFADQDQCIDHDHVFMSGFSMGGYLSNETGCQNPRVRAVAPHSGGSHDLTTCTNATKPVLIMHFDSDAMVPYTCGTQTRDRWVERNGCSAANPMVKPVTGGNCEYYQGCRPGGQVGMCTFMVPPGMRTESAAGHAWSGGSKQGTGAGFAIPETQRATELAWSFFKQYAY